MTDQPTVNELATATAAPMIMTRAMRYYYNHREEANQKRLERYHNDPATIAKREERAQKKAAKEAAAAAKAEERKARKQMASAKMALAKATSRAGKLPTIPSPQFKECPPSSSQ